MPISSHPILFNSNPSKRLVRLRQTVLVLALYFAGSILGYANSDLAETPNFKRFLSRPIVALTTDFGLDNEAVGLCHGAILRVDSTISIVDLCNQIKPFDIRQASLALKRTECFPAGTVFVTVVDPGVGTDRGAIAIKTREGFYFVAPNNGILTEVVSQQGVESAFLIDPLKVNPGWKQGTFDGRDLFSPAGAILASRHGDLHALGRPIKAEGITLLPPLAAKIDTSRGDILCHFIKTDRPYGNAWTDVSEKDLAKIGIKSGDTLRLEFDSIGLNVPFVRTFGNVPKGAPLAYLDSDGGLAFALNMKNFVDFYHWTEGRELVIKRVPSKNIGD
ncbi:MAG: SAM-dependent chlorinase/fluorinase [Candidatus Riflebacteria bacterium]|nr:SAM-dependent chlorinase/fluorinase [Candidatus Riflebacteria bacterium]